MKEQELRRIEHVVTTLSSAIVTYLVKEGLTLKQIGNLIGLSESFISYVKKGTRNFTIAHLGKLEKSLKQPLPLLFLQTIDEKTIPKELKPQYKALRDALTKSAELRKIISRIN